MKFRSVKSDATWSTSATSNASPDGRALVNVDVANAEFAARLEVPVRPRIVQPPAAGIAVPLGGVELHALQAEPPGVVAELIEAGLAVAGIEVVVVGQLVGMGLGELGRLVRLAETLVVELAELGGLEDRVVHVAIVEKVLHQALAALIEVVLVAPDLGFWGQVPVVVVEAVDELLAVDVALILGPGIPQSDVGVDDEVAVAVLAVHVVLPGCRAWLMVWCEGCHIN
jgi:hypothetical protein